MFSRAITTLMMLLTLAGTAMATGSPNYLPDGARPRIWLTPTKLAQIQTKACVDGTGAAVGSCTPAEEWTDFINFMSAYRTSGSYYDMWAWHFALAYVITKDTAYRDRAFALADPVTADMTNERFDSGLYGYNYMQDIALVYDWLYTELGSTRKANYITYMVNFLDEWWNPTNPNFVNSAKNEPICNYHWHHMFATALAALALYGDDSSTMHLVATDGTVYTSPMSFWNAKMAEDKTALDLYGNGGGWYEGFTYSRSTYDTMLYSFLAMKSATGKDYFNDLAFPKQMGNFFFHAMQPDNTSYYPAGDIPGSSKGSVTPADRLDMQLLAEGTEGNPESQWAQYWTESIYKPAFWDSLLSSEVIFRKLSRSSADARSAVPLGYYAPGYGFFNWRTSYSDPNAASLSFLSTSMMEGHQHRNQNSFVLFANGSWQVADEHMYEGGGINQNGHLENSYVIGGHGQYGPNTAGIATVAGSVTRQEFDANHAYVKGDATNAYSTNDLSTGTAILNSFTRAILTTGKYTVVYDRVSAKDTAAVTEYYLHFANLPTISGSTVTATNGSGRVFHTTLYPSVNISVGADTAWQADSTASYLKVVPQSQLADNYLLNTIESVTSGTSTPTATSMVSGTNLRGAMFADATENKVLVFSSTATTTTTGSYSATTTAASRHYISDLTPSASYTVSVDGSPVTTQTASAAGVVSFQSAPTGAHTYSVVQIAVPVPILTGKLSGTIR